MFQVFENGKPCDAANFGVHESWNNSKFTTFTQAKKYAQNWCGEQAFLIQNIHPNVPVDISMCEYPVLIEIREI